MFVYEEGFVWVWGDCDGVLVCVYEVVCVWREDFFVDYDFRMCVLV